VYTYLESRLGNDPTNRVLEFYKQPLTGEMVESVR
jgi:hypothetical protein